MKSVLVVSRQPTYLGIYLLLITMIIFPKFSKSYIIALGGGGNPPPLNQ